MKLETGNPVIDGRYVVYVPGILGWLEPQLVIWANGSWRFRNSTEKYPDGVRCWIGPLPVVSSGDIVKMMLLQNMGFPMQEGGIYPPTGLEYDL